MSEYMYGMLTNGEREALSDLYGFYQLWGRTMYRMLIGKEHLDHPCRQLVANRLAEMSRVPTRAELLAERSEKMLTDEWTADNEKGFQFAMQFESVLGTNRYRITEKGIEVLRQAQVGSFLDNTPLKDVFIEVGREMHSTLLNVLGITTPPAATSEE